MAVGEAQEAYKRRVREANDIVDVIQAYGVTLKRSGRNWTGLCPFHQEKTPSFSVNQEGQFFHCFGCRKGGDVFSFVMEYDRVEFLEALESLARRANIPPPVRDEGDGEKHKRLTEWKEYLYRFNSAARSYYESQLYDDRRGRAARDYLTKRRISEDCCRRFNLGYSPPDGEGLTEYLRSKGAPDRAMERAGLASRRDDGTLYDYFRGRVMFPIVDAQGRVLGFGGRVLGEERPKYLNTRETPIFSKGKVIYGLFQASQALRNTRKAVLVEGYTDVIMCHQFGIENVVAIMGTAMTADHLRQLRRYVDEVVLLTDSDAAGRGASARSLPALLAEDARATVASLPGGQKDPCDFLLEEGGDALRKVIASGVDAFDFKFRSSVADKDMTNAHIVAEVAKELMESISYAKEPLRRSVLRRQVAERLNLKEAELKFVKIKGQNAAAEDGPTGGLAAEAKPIEQRAKPLDTVAAAEREFLQFLLQQPAWIEKAASRVDLTGFSNPANREIGDKLLAAFSSGKLTEQPAAPIVRELDDPDVQRVAVELLERPLVFGKMTEGDEFWLRLKGLLDHTLRARAGEARRRAAAAALKGKTEEQCRLIAEAAGLDRERQKLKGQGPQDF